METENFSDFTVLRATFPSVGYVDGLTVFNIGGSKHRLMVYIHYNRRKVYVRSVLAYSENDSGDRKRKK
jgi:mRNA interferase HigB